MVAMMGKRKAVLWVVLTAAWKVAVKELLLVGQTVAGWVKSSVEKKAAMMVAMSVA